jgi:hypothetical protein
MFDTRRSLAAHLAVVTGHTRIACDNQLLEAADTDYYPDAGALMAASQRQARRRA